MTMLISLNTIHSRTWHLETVESQFFIKDSKHEDLGNEKFLAPSFGRSEGEEIDITLFIPATR